MAYTHTQIVKAIRAGDTDGLSKGLLSRWRQQAKEYEVELAQAKAEDRDPVLRTKVARALYKADFGGKKSKGASDSAPVPIPASRARAKDGTPARTEARTDETPDGPEGDELDGSEDLTAELARTEIALLREMQRRAPKMTMTELRDLQDRLSAQRYRAMPKVPEAASGGEVGSPVLQLVQHFTQAQQANASSEAASSTADA